MSSSSTLLRFIKNTRYDSYLFSIERLNENDIDKLTIKEYDNKKWLFIKNHKIRPKNLVLKRDRVYELEIKERKWNDLIVKTFYLDITLETIDMNKSNKVCLFS